MSLPTRWIVGWGFRAAAEHSSFASCWAQAECWPISEAEIHQVATPHQSRRLLQRFGTGSVCEALALCAASRLAGPQAIHWALPRIVSADRRATLAVAVLAPAGLPPTPTLTSGVPS